MAKLPCLTRAGALLLTTLALPGARTVAQELPGEPITFQSHGATLQGRFFRASGPGAHPSVLLLHGYPGGPGDVLGLGAVLAGVGWNALMFDYRGFHGSEGRHTPMNSMEDVGAALGYLRAAAESLAVDTGRIALVGYSYGGWLALMTGKDPAVRCVAAVAPGNMGRQGRMMQRDSVFRAAIRSAVEGPMQDGRVRSMPYDSIVGLLSANIAALDSDAHAGELVGKPVLVVGGWRDPQASMEQFIAPSIRALRAAGNPRVTPVTLDDDHTFRATRGQLQRTVIDWLNGGCLGQAPVGTAPRS